MKKLILIITHPFRKHKKTFTTLLSEAVSEGILETYKEMGYRSDGYEDQETPGKKGQGVKIFEK